MAVSMMLVNGVLVPIGVPTNTATTDTSQTFTGGKTFNLGAVTSFLTVRVAAYVIPDNYLDITVLANSASGAFAVTTGVHSIGKRVTVKNTNTTNTNNVTLTPAVGLIDGAANFPIPPLGSVTIVSDGNNWFVI